MGSYWPSEHGEVDRITAKPYPWKPIADYNPDHLPSNGAIFYEAIPTGVIGVFQVKGLGVMVLRASTNYSDPQGRLKFDGMSTLSKAEIGYSPKL